ncbi:MAG TPA: hypothetical protein VK804_00240 [Bradyrhizobium sp.]|jgi:hypothetical protein|uniref:hypothetical protein n=1 Tax=Bradyrhizobium sp. TaxID=376 RepID=UPI002B61E062|nr:hypothetical protein [Bradyrhizobium sp.]HTA98878.1 hypothetical protein [Bradyrhizobium sp.]
MTAIDYRMTRRNILIGAAASLICAPPIVRAASLMPGRGLPLQFLNPEFLDPLGQFYRHNFYHSLDSDLRAGRAMSTVSNGKIISVADAQRMVARARAQGWLPPYSTTGKPANVPPLKNGASVSGL